MSGINPAMRLSRCLQSSKPLCSRGVSQSAVNPDKLYKKIEVEVKCGQPAILKSYEYFVTTAAKQLGITVGECWAPKLPIHDRLTLLRSVHIYKKHMEQYEVRTYYRNFTFHKLTGSTADTFLEYIQRNLPEGVGMKVTMTELTKAPKAVEDVRLRLEDQKDVNVMNAEGDDLLRFLHGSLLDKIRRADKVWHSLLYFLSADREDALRRLRLTKEEYKEVTDSIDKSSTFSEFNAGDYLFRNEKKFTRVSTGFSELDAILDLREKGIIPGHIYEICGPPDSGKSVFCHSLAARIALISKKNVLFIDTKGDFHGSAVMEFLMKYAPDVITEEVEQEVVLSASSRIRVATTTLPSKVVELLDDVYRKLKGLPDASDERTYFKSLGCIILDNIANIASYDQAEEDNERGETLMIGSMLHRLADRFLIPIFVVNRSTDVDAELHLSLARNFVNVDKATESMDTQDDVMKAEDDVLEKKLYFTEAGRIWEPLVHHRLDFRADKENRSTVVTLKKSAYRPCGGTCKIKILT